MSVYLTYKETRFYRDEIEIEFQKLLKHPSFSSRGSARQWQFFRHCYEVFCGRETGDFPCSEKQAVQYKFEVNDRLQRHYLGFGKPVKFIFRLVSIKEEGIAGYEEPDYPWCNSYRLRVSYNEDLPNNLENKKLLLEKAITNAVEAEFSAYLCLPEIDLIDLGKAFDRTGSRYKEIAHLLKKHKQRGWVINNEMNPSTKRVVDVRIKSMSSSSAVVHTSEYWLLMWWSVKDERYSHTYKELNRQIYRLRWADNKWLVIDNVYEKPKTSSPRRNIRRRIDHS